MINKIASAIGRFCYKFRILLSILGVVIFAVVIYTESLATISYTNDAQMDYIMDEFPEDSLVVVYSTSDEDNIVPVVSDLLENDDNVVEGYGYYMFGSQLSAAKMADTMGEYMDTDEDSGFTMDESYINLLYYAYDLGQDGMAELTMTGKQFTDFITSDEFLSNAMVSSMMDADTQAMLTQYGSMLTMLLGSTTEYTPAELAEKFGSITLIDLGDSFNESTLTLLYLMYWSQQADLSDVTMSLYDLLTYLCNDIDTDGAFASVIPEEYVSMLSAAQAMIEENIPQLHGDEYSRVILTITYVPESDEIYSFYETLNETLTNKLDNNYYLVGSTAMSYELSLTFHSEYMLITILTAIVIFIIICLTFRKFSVSAFIVCIIECAVFITMTVMAIMNSAMYFIALMMVQCILMGSMVDYGILMSSYYKEVRRTLSKKEALPVVMQKSITAIFTSALIMIGVCFILSFTVSGAIASILRILGIGCLSALILIIFFLPALLSVSDKLITKGWKDIKPFREARKARKNGTAAPAEDSAEPADDTSEVTEEPSDTADAEPAKE